VTAKVSLYFFRAGRSLIVLVCVTPVLDWTRMGNLPVSRTLTFHETLLLPSLTPSGKGGTVCLKVAGHAFQALGKISRSAFGPVLVRLPGPCTWKTSPGAKGAVKFRRPQLATRDGGLGDRDDLRLRDAACLDLTRMGNSAGGAKPSPSR